MMLWHCLSQPVALLVVAVVRTALTPTHVKSSLFGSRCIFRLTMFLRSLPLLICLRVHQRKETLMLSLKNITVEVGNKTVVRDLSLKISPGQLHVLMGPNGSGKSSLAYALAGHPYYKVRSQKSELTRLILLMKHLTNGLSLVCF